MRTRRSIYLLRMVRILQELVATRNQRAEKPVNSEIFCDICKFATRFLFGTPMVHHQFSRFNILP